MLVAVAIVTTHLLSIGAEGISLSARAFSLAPGEGAAAEGRVALEDARRPAARLLALALALALAASLSAALEASRATEVAGCLP